MYPLRNLIDQAAPVRQGEELDTERLRDFLQRHFPDWSGVLHIGQFPRGFSNLTYLLDLGDRTLVLRRPPEGVQSKSAHDMGREYRILSHLKPVYPRVPKPLVYCDDPGVLGAPFYLMERVEGVILRSPLPRDQWPAPETMRTIAEAFVDTFVELHAVDYAAAGLADLGRPQGYVQRQIEGWIQRYQRARTDDIEAMDTVAAWLHDNMPDESGTSLIHNDFKYDNLVLDPDNPGVVRAVLDWEMATIGDPLMDLGTSLGYWVEPHDPPELLRMELSPTTVAGNPTRAELVQLYAERSGRPVDNVLFYYVYGLYKIAVIVQQIYYRYRRGFTRDPRFASLLDAVHACAVTAARAIEKNRIDRLF